MTDQPRQPRPEPLEPDRTAVVYLGDLIRALKLLAPQDDDARRAIVEMLGFRWSAALAAQITEPETPGPRPRPRPELRRPEEKPPPPPAQPSISNRADWLSTLPERLAGTPEPPNLQVKPLQPTAGDRAVIPTKFEPLLSQGQERAILSGALSTESGDGPPDLERLVELLARRVRLERLPRLPAPTLRLGVQLLLDKSEAMMLFDRDQRWLEEEVRGVVGKDKIEVLRFTGSPLQGAGTGPRDDWEDYTPPRAGTVILMLTDLGIGRPPLSTEPAPPAEWLAFAAIARHAGCPLVALVPYPRKRWKGLEKAMTIFEWDRSTTATTVRMGIGLGHRVRQ